MTSIKVKDFGPIAEGSVDLKPLTVFIGPNNSGKSYMSLLVYALSRVTVGKTEFGLPTFEDWRSIDQSTDDQSVEGEWAEALEGISAWRADWGENRVLPVRDLPDEVQSLLTTVLAYDSVFLSVVAIEDELQRCFGAHISQVVRNGAEEFSLVVQDDTQGLLWAMQSDRDELSHTDWIPSLPNEIDLGSILRILKLRRASHSFILRHLIGRIAEQVFPNLLGDAHYLPASRTGILLGHKLLASMIVRRASRVGIEPLAIPRLPGPVADLVQELLLLEPTRESGEDIAKVIHYLEGYVTQGIVEIDRQGEYPEIYFEDDTGRYWLNQVSSTVSEMAPLVLYLKYLVEPGERVIIEEPESHLDAGRQRQLASAIALLVNAGVNVLVTTHSDFFVNELNNLLLASGVDAEYTEDYDANELLRPEQVGGYFFNPGDEGTRVEVMEVTREDGIAVEWSSKVFRDIYDEAIRLEHVGT